MIAQYNVQQLCVDMVRPVSTGIRTREWMKSILPRFSDMVPHIRGMLEDFQAQWPYFDINITHLPYCILPEWGHRISHGGEPTVTFTAGRGTDHGVQDKYDFQASDRTLVEQCDRCVFKQECTGVPHEYLEYYGDDEIKPVSLNALREQDREQSNLTILAREMVRLVEGNQPPTGWHTEAVVEDRRQRATQVRFRHADGGWAALWWTPASEPVPAGLIELGRSAEFRVSCDPGTELSPSHWSVWSTWALGVSSNHPEFSAVGTPEALAATHGVLGPRVRWFKNAQVALADATEIAGLRVDDRHQFVFQLRLLLTGAAGRWARLEISPSEEAREVPLDFRLLEQRNMSKDELHELSVALGTLLRRAATGPGTE
jgi:hypothetical protein